MLGSEFIAILNNDQNRKSGKFFDFSILCEIEVEKKVKEKLICPMLLFKLTQIKIVLGQKSRFDIFTPKRVEIMLRNPFLRKSQFFRWILMVNFHAKMCVLWSKIFSSQNMEENVKINVKKSFFRKR